MHEEFEPPAFVEVSRREKCARRLNNSIYNGSLTMLTIVYSLCLFDIDSDGPAEMRELGVWIEVPALILTIIFLIDLLANFIVLGPKRVWKERRILVLEIILQLVYWLSYIIDFSVLRNISIYGRFARINAVF